MEREPVVSASEAAIIRDIEAFQAELGRRVATTQAISPDQGRIEDGSNPPTHPLRKGGWVRSNDPVWRGAEELAMATGREEVIDRPQ